MSSSFITRIEQEKNEPYTVIFTTDDHDKYRRIVDECRMMIGHSKTTVNAEPVRCMDCKWHEDEEPGMVWCPRIIGSWVSNNWYCASGRRKERYGDDKT